MHSPPVRAVQHPHRGLLEIPRKAVDDADRRHAGDHLPLDQLALAVERLVHHFAVHDLGLLDCEDARHPQHQIAA